MIGPAILLLGSYLAVSSGVDMFLYPKLLATLIGAFICQTGPKQDGALRPAILFVLVAALISALGSMSPLQSLMGLFRSPTAGILGLSTVWMSYEAGLHRKATDWGFITVGAAICSFLAIIQLHPLAPWHSLVPGVRAIGTVGSPPYLGCMLALAVPVAFIQSPHALLFIIPALIATRSKAAIIGAMAGICVMFFLMFRERINKRVIILAGCSLCIFPLVLFNRGQSDIMRIETWRIAWAAFLEHPLFGCGPDNFIDAFIRLRTPAWAEAAGIGGMTASENAHNIVLHILATRGIIGFIFSVAILIGAIARLTNPYAWNQTDRQTALAAGAAVIVYALFNPTPVSAWCVLAFMVGSLGI